MVFPAGNSYRPLLVVGRPILRAEEKLGETHIKDIMVGDEASAMRSSLQMSYPMENG